MSTHLLRGLDRREFITLGLGAFVIGSVPIALRHRGRLVRRTLPVMGTIAEVAVVHDDVPRANEAIDAAMNELARVEQLMTRFAPDSDVGRANLGAGAAHVAIADETALVLTEALRWADSSDGAYDPAIGSAVRLWDVTHRHEPPATDRVSRLAGRRLHRAVELDVRRGVRFVRFHDRDIQVDLGAIAKGYGVDCAAQALRRAGVTRAVVNVGGDLYAIGTNPDGDPWRIGIRDPDDDRALIGTVDVSDAGVATSGTYLQFFRYRGVRYHHLIDPTTGAPRVTPVQSLTVKADTCMHADVAATALYGMAAPRAAQVLALRTPGAEVVRVG